MSKMIQVRHVPDDVHRQLKARAATKGMSLSDYLRTELELIAERALVDEVLVASESEAVVTPLRSSPATVVSHAAWATMPR